jgi:ribosomal protein L37AE/L43A
MLTYKELIELREKLSNGEITLDDTKELNWNDFEEGARSWNTKDWKERRSEIIKDKCEICGSKETLTLQHLSHPLKYNDYEREVAKKHTQTFIGSNTIVDKREFSEHVMKDYDYVPVPLCPNCGDNRPNKRVRKLPQYLCPECRHEFDKPIYKSVDELIAIFYENEDALDVRDKCFISKDKWKNNHNLSNIKYWFQRKMVKNKESEIIGKEAFLLYLDDTIRYLSFEDTITACKKCAFNFDINNMELCPKCREHYKGIQYPTCIQCLPEEKRKAALEKIEFGKEWQAIHKELGID